MRDSFLPPLTLVFGLTAATALAGCGSPSPDFGVSPGFPPDFGESGAPGPGTQGPFTGEGRALFLKTVAPALEQSCASCHASPNRGAPVFMASTAESTYVTLALYGGMISPAVNSRLLQQGTHAGPDLPAEQRQLVAKWLDLDAAERGMVQGQVTGTLEQALSEVGNCMVYNDWTANGLDALSAAKTEDGQACSSCHGSGDSGVFINTDAQMTFEGNRKFPMVVRWVRGDIAEETGVLLGFTPAGVLASYGKAACDASAFDGCHLPYQLPLELEEGIAKFSELTIGHWQGGFCKVQ